MKISKAPLEKKRPLFFAAGLVFGLSITLVSFEWRTPYEIPVIPVGDTDIPNAPQGFVVTLPPPEKTVEKPKLPELELKPIEIELVDNSSAVQSKPEDVYNGEDLPKIEGNFTLPEEKDAPEIEGPVSFAAVMPVYCGGEKAMLEFLHEELKYPEIPRTNGVSGTVQIQFVVGKNGVLRDAKVMRAVDPWLDAEALRVAKMLDCFTPGKQAGRTLDVYFVLPVKFSLGG